MEVAAVKKVFPAANHKRFGRGDALGGGRCRWGKLVFVAEILGADGPAATKADFPANVYDPGTGVLQIYSNQIRQG